MHKMSQGKLIIVLITAGVIASACTQTYSQAPLATPTLISTGLVRLSVPVGSGSAAGRRQIWAHRLPLPRPQRPAARPRQAPRSPSPARRRSPAAASHDCTRWRQRGCTSAARRRRRRSTVVPATKTPTPKAVRQHLDQRRERSGLLHASGGRIPLLHRPPVQHQSRPASVCQRHHGQQRPATRARCSPFRSLPDPSLAIAPCTIIPIPTRSPHRTRPSTEWPAEYGDVQPQDIASANGLSLSSALTVGQQLTIP